MSATKKWKTTLRVERPTGRSISLGAHLEVNGIWHVSPRLNFRLHSSCIAYLSLSSNLPRLPGDGRVEARQHCESYA